MHVTGWRNHMLQTDKHWRKWIPTGIDISPAF